MSKLSRRRLITTGLAATAGGAGLAAAARLADRYGLIPPNHSGVYGLGETLTYASHRLLTSNSLAREFPRSQISKAPFANGKPPENEDFLRLQSGGFQEWRVDIDGLVARPVSLPLAEIKNYPSSSQVTQLICEEGWSFIAEWIGTPLSLVLEAAGILPQARYVVYSSKRGIKPRSAFYRKGITGKVSRFKSTSLLKCTIPGQEGLARNSID